MEDTEQRGPGIENGSEWSNGTVHFDWTGPTEKRGPPQKVDHFFRNFSGWTEPIHSVLDRNFRKFWFNRSRPWTPVNPQNWHLCFLPGRWVQSRVFFVQHKHGKYPQHWSVHSPCLYLPCDILRLIRASSYEPGQPGWLGFRDLVSLLFSL